MQIRVNERSWTVNAAPDTPLLYVLMNELQLQGPRFGCGLAQCGSCSVLVERRRNPVVRDAGVRGRRQIGHDARRAAGLVRDAKEAGEGSRAASRAAGHDRRTGVQCGYCYNGMIIKGSELLSKTPRPTEAQIRTAMNGHLCRCGTYPRIMKAIQRASGESR